MSKTPRTLRELLAETSSRAHVVFNLQFTDNQRECLEALLEEYPDAVAEIAPYAPEMTKVFATVDTAPVLWLFDTERVFGMEAA